MNEIMSKESSRQETRFFENSDYIPEVKVDLSKALNSGDKKYTIVRVDDIEISAHRSEPIPEEVN